MASSYVYLVEMADTAVTRGNGDILKLDIHIVFGCGASVIRPSHRQALSGQFGVEGMTTFNELATVDLSRCNFEGYDMVLGREC